MDAQQKPKNKLYDTDELLKRVQKGIISKKSSNGSRIVTLPATPSPAPKKEAKTDTPKKEVKIDTPPKETKTAAPKKEAKIDTSKKDIKIDISKKDVKKNQLELTKAKGTSTVRLNKKILQVLKFHNPTYPIYKVVEQVLVDFIEQNYSEESDK